jgi:predicted MPP superfamily phosphohydrolase
MPVTLAQLSRREFLKRAALAGAACVVAPEIHAGIFGKSRDKNTFFFLSDTHVAGDPAQTYLNVNMTNHLAACSRELAAWPVKPAAVIVNGDLAYLTGQPVDYAQFAKGIAPIRALAPLHLTLGNHDEREHFWSAFPQDAKKVKSIPQKQISVFDSAQANWFLLDSLQLTSKTPGEVGAAQLDWLAQELDARPQKPAVVVVHHNPQFPKVTTGLLDTDALLAVLAPRRQVKAIIFGHTHDWKIWQHGSGIHLINLPPTSYPFHEGRPSGWVRATLAREEMKIELRSLDAKHPEHAQVQSLKWRV